MEAHHTQEKVQQMRARVSHYRDVRHSHPGTAELEPLARALRGNMRRAGWYRINPDLEDQPSLGPPPVHAVAAFEVWGGTYLYDQVRPHLRAALELHVKESKRSSEAKWLASLLHQDTFDVYAFGRAQPALAYIAQHIKPVSLG